MIFLLNIGHKHPVTGAEFSDSHVANLLRSVEAVPLAVHESDSERTTVAAIGDTYAEAYRAASAVCKAMQQDCVAMLNPITGRGELIGPRSADWGTFNPEFFVLADGRRAAS